MAELTTRHSAEQHACGVWRAPSHNPHGDAHMRHAALMPPQPRHREQLRRLAYER